VGTRLLIGVVLASACTAEPHTSSVDQAATVCGAGPTVNGIDVSEYDDAVDWPTAKAAGIDFAFVRVSDGLAFPDTKFAEYWPGARAGGVMRGAYQYFEPNVDPIQQADLLLSMMGPLLPGDLPPVLDLETADGLSTADVTAAVQVWIGEITMALGRPPIVYAGLYSWPTLTGGADMTPSPLWIAQYTTASCPDIPDPWTQWMFWQHSDTGVVNGVTSSQLDLDVFNGTLAELDAFTVGGGTPCGVIPASGGTIDDSDACFTAGGPTAYMRYVTNAGFDNSLYWTHTTQAAAPVNYGEWDLSFVAAGKYQVEAYTAAAYATSHAAAYHVQTATSAVEVIIDQTAVNGWQSLGDVEFGSGGGQWILLGDDTGEATQEQLVFDAIRFTPLDGSGSGSGSDMGSDGDGKTHGGCSTGDGDGRLALPFVLALGLVVRRRRRRL
jgi:lysozyme